MIGLLRIIWYGIQGFRRNIWLSVIAIITMTLTITTITIFALTNVTATKLYDVYSDQVDYIIFLEDSAPTEDIEQFFMQIQERPEVKSAKYLDKGDTLENFEQLFKDIGLKGIISEDDNPLPREIDVKFDDINAIAGFDTFVNQDQYKKIIDSTSYEDNSDVVASINSLTRFLKIFGLSFTIFFVIIAILVIFNTFRLTIFSRRDEIEIMRLVGATRSFIRGPFIVEGLLFGLIGALVSALMAWVFLDQLSLLLKNAATAGESLNFSTRLLNDVLGSIATTEGFNSLFLQLFVMQLSVGLALGVVCSYVAIRRYLKQ